MAALAPISGAEAALFTVNAAIQEQLGIQDDLGGCFGGTITGSGISSFGAISLAAKDCITPADGFFGFEGKMTFTLFGGDEIFADYSGWFIPTSLPSIFTLKDSSFEITGGTGRFQNAKGDGSLYGTEFISFSQDPPRGWGFIQATGDISGLQKSKKGAESGLELLDLANPSGEGAIVAINELPESGSLALLGIGLASLAFVRRKVSC
ncbi:PEP-CTERM sorting domain-containing protein [Nitrosospira multiformis]|uniref:PEP-CTERM sorting domain-containing protein n=1 Tax=Nitrosospira multiformis TaxID=1231 RepID=UPI001113BA28|nr:PEP-CTERM sorting domain-containing protein [Nitrosospira multiformis]